MKSVLFILSAAYADPELQAEFGAKIPACAVPIGPDTLLRKQMEEAYKIEDMQQVFLAVPNGSSEWIANLVGDDLNRQIFIIEMETFDMKETHDRLLNAFKVWLETQAGDQAGSAVFTDDEWLIHVLNGDTLFMSDVMDHPGIVVTKEENTPFNWQRASGGVYVGKFSYHIVVSELSEELPKYDACMERSRTNEMVVEPENWFDFGHLTTYYRSKRNLLSTRSFNSITLNARGNLVKISNTERTLAETGWYANIPEVLQMYTPRVCPSKDNVSYEMEYIAAPSLAELLVYGQHSLEWWNNIWDKIKLFLITAYHELGKVEPPEDPMLLEKSRQRVQSLREPYKTHALHIIDWMKQQNFERTISYVHGDLCFSNILYDQRTDNIHVIDPRGEIVGSQLYDIAKLYHSTYGAYDFAVANVRAFEKQANAAILISRQLEKYVQGKFGLERTVLLCATALLFYSMLPLHRENSKRVRRLLGTAERLYEEWVKEV